MVPHSLRLLPPHYIISSEARDWSIPVGQNCHHAEDRVAIGRCDGDGFTDHGLVPRLEDLTTQQPRAARETAGSAGTVKGKAQVGKAQPAAKRGSSSGGAAARCAWTGVLCELGEWLTGDRMCQV